MAIDFTRFNTVEEIVIKIKQIKAAIDDMNTVASTPYINTSQRCDAMLSSLQNEINEFMDDKRGEFIGFLQAKQSELEALFEQYMPAPVQGEG